MATRFHRHLLTALTLANFAMLAYNLSRSSPVTAAAAADSAAPVLRGRALEIVDEKGKVRASIEVLPADPNVRMPDGSTGYPESVLLRMQSSSGRPNVKLAATETGAGFVLGGESNPTHVQILAQRAKTLVKLTNKDGVQRLIEP